MAFLHRRLEAGVRGGTGRPHNAVSVLGLPVVVPENVDRSCCLLGISLVSLCLPVASVLELGEPRDVIC